MELGCLPNISLYGEALLVDKAAVLIAHRTAGIVCNQLCGDFKIFLSWSSCSMIVLAISFGELIASPISESSWDSR